MSDLLAIAVVGLGTYVFRALFILSLARKQIPQSILVALRFVAPAVMAALIIALLTDSEGRVDIGVPEMAAFALGGAVAYRTKNHVWTLFAGMAVYWLMRALI